MAHNKWSGTRLVSYLPVAIFIIFAFTRCKLHSFT